MTNTVKERSGRGAIAAGRPTPTVENYLKVIIKHCKKDGTISAKALAKHVGVSGATITAMLKTLKKEGLATYIPYKGARLTPRGRLQATRVIRRHRLLERFLVDVVGVPWDEVDEEAEALEHALSERLEQRIDALLGFPKTDPHGDLIPSRKDRRIRKTKGLLKLCDARRGGTFRVTGVSDASPARLRRLGDRGLKPGVSIQIIEPNKGKKISVRASNRNIALSLTDASAIFVAPAGKD